MTQRWRSLSKWAGRPITTRRDAESEHRRWIAATGLHVSSIQQKRGRWYVVYSTGSRANDAIAAYIPEYLDHHRRNTTNGTHRNVRTQLNRFAEWCRANGRRRLSDLTRRDFDRYRDSLPRHFSATYVRRHLESIRAALNKAVDWEIITANPAARIAMPPNRKTISRRVLTDSEIRIIQTDWPTPEREWSMLCLWAGLRRSEAAYCAWDDVDLSAGILAVTAKPDLGYAPKGTRYRTGEPDTVPLVPWLADALAELPHDGRFVFDRGDDTPLRCPDRWWFHIRRLLQSSDIPDASPHCFRHTFCTRLALAGVERAVLPRIARHLDPSTTDRYIHIMMQDARREIAKLKPVV